MAVAPTAWLTYTNQTYHFSIAYPNTYVLLDQASAQDQAQVKRVFQVRFQDQRIAASPIAHMEPPQFQIEVFDNTATLALGRWVEDHRMNGERADVKIGGQPGLRVTLMTMMAPNQFYYVAQGPYVYRLTPLGPFSEQMLASFSFS